MRADQQRRGLRGRQLPHRLEGRLLFRFRLAGGEALDDGQSRARARACATICSAARRSAGTLDFSAALTACSTSSPPKVSSALQRRDAHRLGRLVVRAPVPTSAGAAVRNSSEPTASMAASCTDSGRRAVQQLGNRGRQRRHGIGRPGALSWADRCRPRDRAAAPCPTAPSCFSASARISGVALSLSA